MGFTKRRKLPPEGAREALPERHQTAEQRRLGIAPRCLPLRHMTAEQRAAAQAQAAVGYPAQQPAAVAPGAPVRVVVPNRKPRPPAQPKEKRAKAKRARS